MCMTEKKIRAGDPDAGRIRRLYREAFPPEERIPYDDLMRLTDAMPLDFTAYYENGAFIGFTVVYPHEIRQKHSIQ